MLLRRFGDKKIINRLKRANGQVGSLIKLVEEEKDCMKVIVQFQAAKAALEGAYSEMLSSQLSSCLKDKDQEQINKILKLISKHE